MAEVVRFPLSGFADEISPDLTVQVETLQKLGVAGLDLRSVGGVNVLDLAPEELLAVHSACAKHGLIVQSVGSPVNKIPYDLMSEGRETDRLRAACKAAQHLGIKRVRIFTPEVPEGKDEEYTKKIIDWMASQKGVAHEYGVILIVENDAKFWSAYPENAKKLFAALGDETFRAVFDFANTILLGFDADDWFPWLTPYLDTIHIKDAIRSEGRVVPAGKGDGKIKETLQALADAGWSGPITLEPHLQAAGEFGGFSGPDLFEVAVNAVREVWPTG